MISQFRDEYRFLSNFWYFHAGDNRRTTVEHHYQAAKTRTIKEYEYILNSPSPAEAKRRGRKVSIREDWEEIKFKHMLELLRWKFTSDRELGELLLNTGHQELQEGNTWGDTIWGVDLKTGKGENNLGKMLMQVRHELKNGAGW